MVGYEGGEDGRSSTLRRSSLLRGCVLSATTSPPRVEFRLAAFGTFGKLIHMLHAGGVVGERRGGEAGGRDRRGVAEGEGRKGRRGMS